MNFIEWDKDAFIQKASKGSFAAKAARGDVFRNNNEVFKNGGYRTDSGVEVTLSDLEDSSNGTIFYSEEFNVSDAPVITDTTFTGTINKDCMEVAKDLIERGYNPALLNLADAYVACGGYYKGTKAQEESLCRQTTLSQTLYQYYDKDRAESCGVTFKGVKYPMDRNFGAVYSPKVTVFRKGQGDAYAFLENPYQVSIISCAALNFNSKGQADLLLRSEDGGFTLEGKNVMMNKIRTILRVAIANGHDSAVLGAFGCGAFNLIPEKVTMLFKRVLMEKEFYGKLKFVVFAILESPDPKKSGTYGKFAAFYLFFGRYERPLEVLYRSTAVETKDDTASKIKAGVKVKSPKFGEGTVKETDGTYAIVDFAGVEKKLSIEFAKLEVIG